MPSNDVDTCGLILASGIEGITLSTTTANITSTEELETANLLTGSSSGMYPYNCLFKF